MYDVNIRSNDLCSRPIFGRGQRSFFEVTYALYHFFMYVCIYLCHSLVPRPRPKTGQGLGKAMSYYIMHACSTQCVAVNCEVPVTLYSVCIRAEKACL